MSDTVRTMVWRSPHDGIEYDDETFTWHCRDVEALGVAIKSLDKYCNGNALFRGQRDASWPLHSKFRRELVKSNLPPKSECTMDTLHEWNPWHFALVRDYLERFSNLKEGMPAFAEVCEEHGADFHFELHKATQQYAKEIGCEQLSCGSNFVDFTSGYMIGLFFSAHDPDGEDLDKSGAVIVYDPSILNHNEDHLTQDDGESMVLREFREDLSRGDPKSDFPYYHVKNSIPCERTSVQKAAYLAQMNFRQCATFPWRVAAERMQRQHFCKLVYAAELKPGVLAFCEDNGIDKETMYPFDSLWQDILVRIGARA